MLCGLPQGIAAASKRRRPRVAAIYTVLRFRSHAYNILRPFMAPYYFNGELVDPGCEVVSLYADQFPDNDRSRVVSKQYGIPLYSSIEKALCRGGEELDVDAVLLIGEHGDYPLNDRGQRLYPRKEFFDQIVAVMKRSNKFVPLFNDKHLSYRWDWAKEMYDVTQKYNIPFMAGSSVPLAERRPPLELPQNAEIEEAVSIHGGGVESYDFHGLEVLQSLVEARRGGETGIAKIEFLEGDALLKAGEAGRWSRELAEAAMQAEREIGVQRQRERNVIPPADWQEPVPESPVKPSHGLLITYKDGLRASVLKVGSSSNRWNFACRLKREPTPRATAFYNGPWGNRCLFNALSHAVQHLFKTHQQPYPVERTLLVTGALDAAMRSREAGKPLPTPHLEFAYAPIDFSKLRENGASWKKITVRSREPVEFEPFDGDVGTLTR